MSSSVSGSSDASDVDVEDMILDQPIYYVLSQFLVTEEGNNVATCLQELTKEVKELRKVISSYVKGAAQ
jgi:hypothetical protein